MTWCPQLRIVNACPAAAVRARGLVNIATVAWPSANIGGGADYSVDFSDVLGGGEYIVGSPEFGISAYATVSWSSIFGNIATAWVTWTASGYLTIPVGVVTNLGNTYQVDVSIYVDETTSLETPVPPAAP